MSTASSPDAGRQPRSRVRAAAFVAVWAVLCSALHFGGLAFDIYTRYWWWDLMTHSLSGFGVAGVAYVVRPGAFERRRVAYLAVPLAVLLVGAGFEVYEYLFKDFYVGWTAAYYAQDTLVDLVLDTVGGGVFGLLARPAMAPPRRGAAPTVADDRATETPSTHSGGHAGAD